MSNGLIPLADPAYVVAPVLQSRSGREDMKKLFAGSIPYPNMNFIASILFHISFEIS